MTERTDYKLPYSEAMKKLKAMRGKRFFFHATVYFPCATDAGKEAARTCCIIVSRNEMLNRLENIFHSEKVQTEVLISFSDHGRYVFIGG